MNTTLPARVSARAQGESRTCVGHGLNERSLSHQMLPKPAQNHLAMQVIS